MGCDIHLAIEILEHANEPVTFDAGDVRVEHAGVAIREVLVVAGSQSRWVVWATPPMRRDYDLFGLMAGVRRPEMALFQDRGYPPDSPLRSAVQEEAMLGEVQHHRSFLSREEFSVVVRRYREIEHASSAMLRELTMIEAAMAMARDARVVFGFDN